jgi:hypothetical protein
LFRKGKQVPRRSHPLAVDLIAKNGAVHKMSLTFAPQHEIDSALRRAGRLEGAGEPSPPANETL